MKRGRFIVLAGPSGVGKGTVARYIVENFDGFALSISATTRSPRPGEQDGQDYYFLEREVFEQMIQDGQLLEWALVHGQNYYGTPRDRAESLVASGLDVILEIDLQGARQVKQAMPEALSIFLEPPSIEVLRERLVNRGTESEAERLIRLQTAQVELAAKGEFDLVLVNDQVSDCAKKVVDWLQSQ